MKIDKKILLEAIANNDIKPDLIFEGNKIYFTQSMKDFVDVLIPPDQQPKSSYSFTILDISDDRRRMA